MWVWFGTATIKDDILDDVESNQIPLDFDYYSTSFNSKK